MDCKGKKQQPKLIIPSCPCEEEGHFDVNTYEEKIISDYCGISLFEVYELNIFEHWFLLHDAVVYENSQTEEGRKHLDKCWRLTQTTADKDKLRAKFGKGEKHGWQN